MFPARHFAPRYFAARYWPKVGATVAAPVAPSGGSYLLRRPPRFEHETISLVLSRGIGVAVISTPELSVIRQAEPVTATAQLTATVAYAVLTSPVLAGVVTPAAVNLVATETRNPMALAEARIARAVQEAQDMADLILLGL